MYRFIILALLGVGLPIGESLGLDFNVAAMQQIHSNRDNRSSPCTNFWAYSCGNWSSEYADNFGKLEDDASYMMAVVLAVFGYNETMPSVYGKLMNYLGSCFEHNLTVVELPVVLSSANSDWTVAAAKYRKYGLNGVFFDEASDVAYNNSRRYVVELKMPSLVPSAETQFGRDLKTLWKKYSEGEEGTDSPLMSWTFAELKQQIPQINWQNYFKELLGTEPSELDLRVEVSDVDYLRDVGVFLQHSNLSVVEHYLATIMASFAKKIVPSRGIVDCVKHMRAVLPLGMEYVYKYSIYWRRAEGKSQPNEIFESLRSTLAKYLDGNRLQLTPVQLEYLRAKLRAMKLKIGNLPDDSTLEEFLRDQYASANFTSLDFQQNFWEALRLRTYLQHAPLLQRSAALNLHQYYRNDDVFVPRTAPYFEAERNTVTIPLIFLRDPMYDPRQHAIFKHSLLGFVLAHEMSHAFDQDGIIFDAVGNESPTGMSILKLPAFQAALQCVQGTHKTPFLKERLADVNGLQLAYDAFFGMFHDSKQVEYRPYAFESELRAPQLFHVNFAQFFCGRLPTAIGHDMDDVRVNEAVKNLHQFATDFNCRQESSSQSVGCEMWRPLRS